MIAEINTHLQEQFLIKKGLRTLLDVAAEIGMNDATLRRWLRGEDVNVATLRKIELWVTPSTS